MPCEEPPHSASALIHSNSVYFPTGLLGTIWHNLEQLIPHLWYTTGWVKIPLEHINAELVRTFLKQNHLQGRDELLRQVKVVSPVVTRNVSPTDLASFTSQEMQPAQVPIITQSIHPRLVCCR